MKLDHGDVVDVVPDPEAPKCGSPTRKGTPCTQARGYGTDHPGVGPCKFHGGATVVSTNKSLAAQAAREMTLMGYPVDINPLEALLGCIRVSYGEVAYCTAQIAKLEESDLLVQSKSTHVRPLNLGKDGEDPSIEVTETTTQNEAKLHVWIRVRHDAMERSAKFSKMAIDAGIAERLVNLEERQAELLVSAVRGILTDLGVADDPRALPIVRKHLAAIDTTAEEVDA